MDTIPAKNLTSSVAESQVGVKKIFTTLFKIFVYFTFVGLAIYYTPKILSHYLNTAYPMAAITSGSMWPQLKVNDLVFMKGIKGSETEVGQIIIYQNEKGFTIHRLIRRSENILVTKGDANNVEDVPITEDQVIGRAVYLGDKPLRIPWLGGIAKNLGPKLGN